MSVHMRIKTPPFIYANLSQPHECTCAETLGEIKKLISLINKIKETNLCAETLGEIKKLISLINKIKETNLCV